MVTLESSVAVPVRGRPLIFMQVIHSKRHILSIKNGIPPVFWPMKCHHLSGCNQFLHTFNFSHGRNAQMKELLKRLWQEEEGQDLTEYALLLVLISLVAVAAMGELGSGISDAFSNAAANLTSSTS